MIKEVIQRPPAELFKQCKEPKFKGPFKTVEDIVQSREDWMLAYALCASSVKVLDDWLVTKQKQVQ